MGWGTERVYYLREYRSQKACEAVSRKYNVEHVWDGPQGLMPEVPVDCAPDIDPKPNFPLEVWLRGRSHERVYLDR
jgi:hypothetical protein